MRRAVAALARTGLRPLPGVRSRALAATRTARPRAVRVAGAKPSELPASAKPADREASRKGRAVTARRARAPRGQTQATVLAALRFYDDLSQESSYLRFHGFGRTDRSGISTSIRCRFVVASSNCPVRRAGSGLSQRAYEPGEDSCRTARSPPAALAS